MDTIAKLLLVLLDRLPLVQTGRRRRPPRPVLRSADYENGILKRLRAAMTTTTLENFCHGFLLNDPGYRHLYDILEDYTHKFIQIELDFHDKETFCEAFRSICLTVIDARNDAPRLCRGYVLAILGFAAHVHKQCQNFEWYDIDTMVIALVDILTFVNFKPSDLCKNYFCHIL